MNAPRGSSARAEPFGFWPSDFSAREAVEAAGDYSDLLCDEQRLLWVELLPAESCSVVMQWTSAGTQRLTPAGFSVRSRVYEYGGGAFCLIGGQLAFVNDADQQIYLQPLDQSGCRPLTRRRDCRYGGLLADRTRTRVLAVEEQRDAEKVIHRLVAFDLAGARQILAEGADFYAAPALRPDGGALAWVEWSRPDLPWTRTRLCRADLDVSGSLQQVRMLGQDESLQQPLYDALGRFLCLSDRSGYWIPWRVEEDGDLVPLQARQADHAPAPWQLSGRQLCALVDGGLALTWMEQGFGVLAVQPCGQSQPRRLAEEYSRFRALTANRTHLFCIAGSPECSAAILRIDLASGDLTVLQRIASRLAPAAISRPVPMTYRTTDYEIAHGFFYAPQASQAEMAEASPPLVIFTHGGPTSACYPVLDNRIQFWTQRGFAVADLNYRGSAGFGRAYRNRLCGNWGLADVQDCLHVIDHLASERLIDPARVFIRGSSAGGFTSLCALAAGNGRFLAAASLYGVTDLLRLRESTHKFEADYIDWLVGDPAQVPEHYRDRSPLHQAARIDTPVIFFQGLDDTVVPPDQTHRMAEALRERGVPVVCLEFAGEGHGFRRPENLQRALEEELRFYRDRL